MKIRVKQIADDEVEISFVADKPQAETSTPVLSIPTLEREAGERLKTLLKDAGGVLSARDCFQALSAVGCRIDEMNGSRVRRSAGVDCFQKEGRSWWFLEQPISDAALKLKTFLAAGERPASECVEHLGLPLNPQTEMTLWIVRRSAGVMVTQKDERSMWSLSPALMEIAESFNFEFDDGVELIDEDGCGWVGWGSR